MAFLTLAQPLLDATLLASLPLMILGRWVFSFPVPLAMLSFCPLYVVAFQLLLSVVGAVPFAREFGERLPMLMLPRMLVTYLPYQWLLGLSALRATWRELRGKNNWEKTEHFGAHRVRTPIQLVKGAFPE